MGFQSILQMFHIIEKHDKIRLLSFFLPFLTVLTVDAEGLVSENIHASHVVELRTKIEYDKTWKDKYTLEIDEEVRSILGGSYVESEADYESNRRVAGMLLNEGTVPAYFEKSYTTLTFTYQPIDYLSLGGGYTLKLYGDKDWSDPKKFIRHRFFFSVIPQVSIGDWKLSLRERVDLDYRADSLDQDERKNAELSLRSRLRVDYTMPHKPLRFYVMTELHNTLNVPTDYLNRYATNNTIRHYGQYIRYVRPEVGMRWQINDHNYLYFYYRFAYSYSRDVQIDKEVSEVELMHNVTYKHIIGLTYQFSN